MTEETKRINEPLLQRAIDELKAMVLTRFPEASFLVVHGEDPEGIYLRVMADVEDRGAVLDVILDRLVDFQVDDGLPLYVLPVRPPARNAAILAASVQIQRPPEALPIA